MNENTVNKIKASILKTPERANRQVAKNLRVTLEEVEHVRALISGDLTELPTGGVFGVTLGKLRVLSRRPAESAAKFIKRLPLNRGFCPKDLSLQWGMSEATIRRYARDMECIKFVEVCEDEWKPMVMNPETAQKYV